MSKGDSIEVLVSTPSDARSYVVTATKAGRSVVQSTRPARKPIWLDVNEVTRTNRPTGNRLTFRLDAVLAIRETALGVPDAPRAKPPTRAQVAATGRAFERMGRPEPLGLPDEGA